ncbi:manganese catalase family protein [Halomonas sp. ISL-60]|nr:manganese catalase family protein [Halomonas sp. ISL-60]
MLCALISQLLDGATPAEQQKAAEDPVTAAIMGGINPQHLLVSGLGGLPTNSNGVPWNGAYIVASGNLLADMRCRNHSLKPMNFVISLMGRIRKVYGQIYDPIIPATELYHDLNDKSSDK